MLTLNITNICEVMINPLLRFDYFSRDLYLVGAHNYQSNILSHFLGHARLFGQESKKRGTPTELNAIIRSPVVSAVFAFAREP